MKPITTNQIIKQEYEEMARKIFTDNVFEKDGQQFVRFKIDLMRDYLWPFYHKWILHKGRKINFFATTCHENPYYILTPKLFDRQVKNARDN